MKITDRNLFGAYLHGISNNDNIISIRENKGETTIGEVVGYTRGGYRIESFGEIQVPTVLIKDCFWNLWSIKIENILEITDEFKVEFWKDYIPADNFDRLDYYMTINGKEVHLPNIFEQDLDFIEPYFISLLKERYQIDYTEEIEFMFFR